MKKKFTFCHFLHTIGLALNGADLTPSDFLGCHGGKNDAFKYEQKSLFLSFSQYYRTGAKWHRFYFKRFFKAIMVRKTLSRD